jgi:undecaprenyl-diphosphatase
VIDWLASADRWLFVFINSTLANPLGDVVWPAITDYDKVLAVRIVLVAAWLWLLVRGGAKGRTAALLLIPVLVCGDQLASGFLKQVFGRARPCHIIDGARVVEHIHLLVDCGPGKSFPSSHAVNNGAAATVFAFYYRRFWPYFWGWALLIAASRVAVGVHYPSDAAGGLAVGALIAMIVILIWESFRRRFLPPWGPPARPVVSGTSGRGRP